MKKRLAIPLLCVVLLLSACGNSYTEDDLRLARESAYQSGYESGFLNGSQQCGESSYKEGYSAGESAGFEAGRAAGYEEGVQSAQAAARALPAAEEPPYDAVPPQPSEGESPPLLTLEPQEGGSDAPAPDRGVPDGTVTVYVTKSGTKYHSAGCSYLSSSKIEISLDDAKSKGYTPCSKCNPPQ